MLPQEQTELITVTTTNEAVAEHFESDLIVKTVRTVNDIEDQPADNVSQAQEIVQEVTLEIPVKKILEVPFTSQAPYEDWSQPYQDACEEASAIILAYYLSDQNLNKDIANEEILNLVDWQNSNFGDFKDTTAAKTAEMIEKYYGYKTKVAYDISINDIKLEIAKGNPVIIPAAGQLLGNRYFTPPGPVYHMLVVIGYDDDEIITNDPGTKRGAGYRYDYDVFYNAIHDWTGSYETINEGRKAMIVVTK